MSQKPITTIDILLLLPMSILSFADAITDILLILTLIEFYKAGHENWAAVGMFFMFLPCLVSGISCFLTHTNGHGHGDDEDVEWTVPFGCLTGSFCRECLYCCSLSPFTAAFLGLEAFIICAWKKIWLGETISVGSRAHTLVIFAKRCAFAEVIFESAPQFITQLYVVNVQKEPVSIIQMISLPISFLSIVWTFKNRYEEKFETGKSIKHKIVIFITHLLVLSARLFAITYFIVAFKWWIISVMFAHFIGVRILIYVWRDKEEDEEDAVDWREWCTKEKFAICILWFGEFTTDWLGSEGHEMVSWVEDAEEPTTKPNKMIQLSFITFIVFQNIFMILLYYFLIQNTWYSLHVTVCVCLFSAAGAIINLLHSNLFLNKHNVIQPE